MNDREKKLDELKDKSYQLGAQAAAGGWMEFCVKDFGDDELFGNDAATLMQMDQEGWEETDEYQVKYRKLIDKWIMGAFDLDGFGEGYIDIMQELTTSFFEGFYDEQNVKGAIAQEKEFRGIASCI